MDVCYSVRDYNAMHFVFFVILKLLGRDIGRVLTNERSEFEGESKGCIDDWVRSHTLATSEPLPFPHWTDLKWVVVASVSL